MSFSSSTDVRGLKEFLFWKKKQLSKGGDQKSFAVLLDCIGGISTSDLNFISLNPGENLQLYGLKGILGNCGGAGQCSTCFVSVEGGSKNSLSPLTSVEEEKLKNRPENWRLACQTLIKSSSVILTKPQSPPSNLEELKKTSENKKLPR